MGLFSNAKGANADGIEIRKDGVYWNSAKIEGADPKTFVSLGMGYAKDAGHIYFFQSALTGVVPTQFRKINSKPEDFSFRDNTRVFLAGKVVEGADPETFQALGDGLFKDKAHIYWHDEPQKDFDLDSFRYLGLGYGKDKSKVYQFGSQGGATDGIVRVVEGADAASFEVIPGAKGLPSVPDKKIENTPDSKDRKNQFRNGKILPK